MSNFLQENKVIADTLGYLCEVIKQFLLFKTKSEKVKYLMKEKKGQF